MEAVEQETARPGAVHCRSLPPINRESSGYCSRWMKKKGNRNSRQSRFLRLLLKINGEEGRSRWGSIVFLVRLLLHCGAGYNIAIRAQ